MEENVDAVGVGGCGRYRHLGEWIGNDEGPHEVLMDELPHPLGLEKIVVECTEFSRNRFRQDLLSGK